MGRDRGDDKDSARPFWESPWLWIALAAASLIPFLGTTILPFNDLPNHVGRHYVFLNAPHDAFLQRYYTVHWSLIGNLGVDLIVRAIGPWLGAEWATNAAVAIIPPLTIAGIYALSRATDGRVAPAALAATPLALNWPLITGFINFSLSAAMALLVLALWVRLRHLSFLARLVIFFPLSFATWLAHTAGWGLLGLGIFAYECSRALKPSFRPHALLTAPLQTAPFAAMFVPIALWRSRTTSGVGLRYSSDFIGSKLVSLASAMREHFMAWDLASTIFFAALILFLYWRGGRRIVWPAAVIAATFSLAFIVCPQELLKSGFADRRLLTYAAIMVALSVGLAPELLQEARARKALTIGAVLCVALFAARIAVAGVVWHQASRANEERLALIDQVPMHSRIFGLVVEECRPQWNRIGRPDHLQQYALVRRDSMVNGMFQNSGLNQVEARYARETGFDPNMLALVHDQRCPVSYIIETLQSAMQRMPRALFDYVWIVGEEPLQPFDTTGLQLIAARGNDRLYRVNRTN